MLQHLDRYRSNPLVRVAGFGRVIDSAHVVQRASAVEIQFRYTGTQAAMLARLLLLGHHHPMAPSGPSEEAR